MLREGNQSTNLINRLTLNYAVIYQTHQLVVMGRQSALTLQSQALSVLLSSAAITPCLLLTSD